MSGWLGIGPGQAVTPLDVEQALLTLLATIDRAVAALEESENEASEAGLDYELAYARAIVRSQASNAEKRKAESILAVEDLLRAKVRAEAVRVAKKERMKALLEQVEIVRSIGASVRTSYDNTGAREGAIR